MLHFPARYDRTTQENNGARGTFDAEVRALGLEPQHGIKTEHAEPPVEVAETLGLPAGEPKCLARRRRLLTSGIPVRLNASWFPLDIAEGTVLEEGAPVIVGGVKTALAERGCPQVTTREHITPNRLPTDTEALTPEISPERTVMEITHMVRTAEGKAVEVTIAVAPAHYLVAEYEFPLA